MTLIYLANFYLLQYIITMKKNTQKSQFDLKTHHKSTVDKDSDSTNQNIFFQDQNQYLDDQKERITQKEGQDISYYSEFSDVQFFLNEKQKNVIVVQKGNKNIFKEKLTSKKIKSSEQKQTKKRYPEKIQNSKKCAKQTDESQDQQRYLIKQTRPKDKYIKFNHNFRRYQINYQVLPYLFSMSYFILEKIELIDMENSPKISRQIFQYTVRKLIVRRTKQGTAAVNRMKYQEKIKFLIRAYLQKKKEMIGYQNREDHRDMKMLDRFNQNEQKRFFMRQQVRKNFVALTNRGIESKNIDNQQKIREFQNYIKRMLNEQHWKAKQFFKMVFTRKQLPWTSNMFADIKMFRDRLYKKYVKDNSYLNNNIINKQDFHQDSQPLQSKIILVKREESATQK